MQWMEETSTAVENRRKNAGRIDQFGSAKLPFNTRGMALLLPRPAKRQSGKQGRYRVAAAAAVASHALGMVTANFEVDLRISLDPPRFSVKRSISPAIHVTIIFAGDFLGRLLVVALEILADCQLRAEAREFLKRVVAKRRAQAQKCYGDQKAC
jgi:hypothetical protein